MKNPHTIQAPGPRRRVPGTTRVLPWVLCLLVSRGIAGAATIITVLPGTGTLEAAIASAAPGDVFRLSGGGEYLLSPGSSTFGRIEGGHGPLDAT